MTIVEALKLRGPVHGYFLTRDKWNEGYVCKVRNKGCNTYCAAVVLILSDSPDGILIQSWYEDLPSRKWQPTAEDLTAEDWKLVR